MPNVKLKDRIAYKQSRFVVLLAFGLGILFSATQIYVDYLNQVKAFTDNVHQVVNIMKRPATEAAYHLDPQLAETVANGLFEHSSIRRVEIFGVLGTAQVQEQLVLKEHELPSQEYKWLSSVLFGDQQIYEMPLVFNLDGQQARVGVLLVSATPYNVAGEFFDRSMNGILFGIIRTGLFAFVVLCFFFYNFSSPLAALTSSWAKINPEQPSDARISLPEKHQTDEFGLLATNANRFLSSLQAHFDRLQAAEKALIRANETLENRVAERTTELQSEISVRIETEQALQTKSEIILLLKKQAVIANEASSFQEAVQHTLSSIAQSIECPLAHAYLYSIDTLSTVPQSSLWYMENTENHQAFRDKVDVISPEAGVGLPGKVLDRRNAVWVTDLCIEPYVPGVDLTSLEHIRTGFAFPVLVDGQVLAILEFFFQSEMRPNDALLEAMDDITIQHGRVVERERTAKKLTAAKEEAIAATKAKSVFLATMSHEIRTPMNGVQGMLQVLEQSELDTIQRETVEVIRDSASMLTTIIDDILDFSKIEAGQFELETVLFSPRAIVEGVSALMSSRAKEKGLALVLEVAENVPEILNSDPVRIRQVLINLVSNAIKFTTHGMVSIGVSSLENSDTTARLLFQVTDTGCGLTKKQISKLFLPFVQADASISRRFGGTGLGLSICERIVALMGGEIGVDSQPEQGSRFWFKLDVGVAEKGALLPSNDATRVPPVLSLLVVEDNPINQKVVFNLLSNQGHKVVCASNGVKALAILNELESDIDAVFMDMHMPEMDGLEATRRIRDLSNEMSKVPIIMLSADVLSNSKKIRIVAGVSAFIPKPIELKEVNRILIKLFGARGAGQPTRGHSNPHDVASTPLLIDESALQALQASIGDPLLKELIDDFIQHCEANFSEIRLALKARNLSMISEIAHSLKGAARELKATKFEQFARQMEHANQVADVEDMLSQLVSCFNETIDVYRKLDFTS